MDNGNVIRPLILEESANDAEALASALRNAGFAVRYKHIEDAEDLQEALESQKWDLLLAAQQVGDFAASQALSIIKNSGKDIPCIIFGSERSDTLVTELVNSGAADFVSEDAQEHLLLVIKREINNLKERRDHRRCKALYNESEKRNRTLLDSSRDPIAYIHEGMHIYTNQSYQDIFGYDDIEELESVPIMDLITPDEQQSFKDVLRSISNDEPPQEAIEYQAVRVDGDTFTATMGFSRASIDGESCTQVMIHRKSNNKALEKEIEQLRQQDLLTGLYNHQYFMEQVQVAVDNANKNEERSALIYIEPDNFKNIKDTLGIAESDIVLSDIATYILKLMPEDALTARYAGTIFAVLLTGPSHKHVVKLANTICVGMVEKIFDVEGKTVTTTCSVGVSTISETTPDAKKAIAQTEAAAHVAKENNGNHVHVFTMEDELATQEADKRIVTLLNLALKNNRFILQYQPIVSLHAEPGERYEVLLRLLDQDDTIIMPGDFMTAAEQANLMVEIDKWVIKGAAKALLEKRKIGKEIQFFIKLSSESLCEPSLLVWISKLLQAARLHGDSLVFEVSEQTVLENLKAAKIFSDGLKQLHSHLAIDHAGKESEDLSYIKNLHLRYLKVDGSHINNVSSEDSQDIIKRIAEVGRENNILTIAEHVQDPACLAILWQHGVNFIQGYYLQQPETNLDYDFTSNE
ncbi:MAG: EAL domain-containing protein [Ectothiorhodospiraceae bacterium]|nr:EAL domain-containing protein [Ectothiorhodospiraceae bacterium]